MFDSQRVDEWQGQDVVDPEGHPVGRLEEVYADNYGASAGFGCVKTGLFGRRLTFVPLDGASVESDHVRVAYPADQIKHAPSVEPDGALTPEEEAALFAHYGLDAAMDPQTGLAPPLPAEAELAPPPPRLVRHYSPAEAANVAHARRLADQGYPRGEGYPGVSGGVGALDADRLSALEERVARLEDLAGR
jgi:hypothetical protein